MVTRSNVNFNKYLIEIYTILEDRIGLDRTLKFLDYYYGRYEPHNRSFIDWKLALALYDDVVRVNKIGTKWYACVGVGGVGKSTFMKNVFYFQDETFNLQDRVFTDWIPLIKSWHEFGDINTNKATLLDEPDEYPWQSQQGKKLRKVLGKARQGSYFFGICATDLADIPNFLFKKLDGIFFIWCHGQGLYFRNLTKKKAYVVQDIKRKYAEKGYNIFFQYQKMSTSFKCMIATPFTVKEEKGYIEKKKNDFMTDLKGFLSRDEPEKKGRPVNEKHIMIKHFKRLGYSNAKIGREIGLSGAYVGRVLTKLTPN